MTVAVMFRPRARHAPCLALIAIFAPLAVRKHRWTAAGLTAAAAPRGRGGPVEAIRFAARGD